ncbi:MAG: NAD-dependent epimerase/dehydratase family protein [Dehalococcoidales bacterium]|nr:NAD-dependent epimerase/dehydratase family protein [Dehalococcoidales bacterium]
MSYRDYTKYFVTGGAGFIGSHLVDKLISEGKTVTVYDNLVSGKKKDIEHHIGKDKFKFLEADLLDYDTLVGAMKGYEVVWHLGANTDIPGGNRVTDLDLKNCTTATRNVLEAMRANKIGKMLFASSACVYGDAPPQALSETYGPLHPINLYGAGKLACEGLISSYCHLFGIQAWMFRFANVVGARMGHGVIYDFIQKLKKNPKELEILGDGHQQKPFFLVEDCISGMICAFDKTNKPYDVFNLGTETFTNVTRIGEIVIEEMGLKDVKIKYTGGARGWPGDVPIVFFSTKKINGYGWEASRTSDEAVRTAARRLLGNE